MVIRNWIQLTAHSVPVFVNMSNVATIQRSTDYDTMIQFVDNATKLYVSETPEEVMEILARNLKATISHNPSP